VPHDGDNAEEEDRKADILLPATEIVAKQPGPEALNITGSPHRAGDSSEAAGRASEGHDQEAHQDVPAPRNETARRIAKRRAREQATSAGRSLCTSLADSHDRDKHGKHKNDDDKDKRGGPPQNNKNKNHKEGSQGKHDEADEEEERGRKLVTLAKAEGLYRRVKEQLDISHDAAAVTRHQEEEEMVRFWQEHVLAHTAGALYISGSPGTRCETAHLVFIHYPWS
jgi:hypothetical protein